MLVRSVLAAPMAAHLVVEPYAAAATDMGPGRIGAAVAALLGLAAVVVGGLSLSRSTGRTTSGPGRGGTVAALAAAVIAMTVGALVVITADGGLGTGNGLGGALVALLLGLLGALLTGLALSRSRRTD
ncbi:DUF6223 family protein [Streptomyces sp. NPDC004726]